MLAGVAPHARDQVVDRAIEHRPAGLRGCRTDVREHDDVRQPEQRVAGIGRLDLEHIEAGAGDAVFDERTGEGDLIDDAAARRVDDDRGRLHDGDGGVVEEVARRRVEIDVQRHDVGTREPIGKRTHALDSDHRGQIVPQVERGDVYLAGERTRHRLGPIRPKPTIRSCLPRTSEPSSALFQTPRARSSMPSRRRRNVMMIKASVRSATASLSTGAVVTVIDRRPATVTSM